LLLPFWNKDDIRIMIIIIFFFGLAIGSFLNMLVWRMQHQESILGRSYCDQTREKLEVIDLFPVVSYILHKGKCRKCQAKLPIIYPIVELVSGLLAALTYWRIETTTLPFLDHPWQMIAYVIVNLLVVYLIFYFALYDLHYWEVEVRSVIVAFVILAVLLVINQFVAVSFLPDLVSAVFGGLAGAGLIGIVVLITKGGGMGTGDIFLFGLAGMIVGIEGIWWAFMAAVLTGSLLGIIVLLIKRKLKGVMIQFAPLIAWGTIIVFLFKFEILELVKRLFYL